MVWTASWSPSPGPQQWPYPRCSSWELKAVWGPVDEAPQELAVGARVYRPKARQSTNADIQGAGAGAHHSPGGPGGGGREPELREGAEALAVPWPHHCTSPAPPRRACTHHFKPLDQIAEVGVLLVIVDQG